MGTHPIFESDFDCLTDKFRMFSRLNRVALQGVRSLSAPRNRLLLRPNKLAVVSSVRFNPTFYPESIQEAADRVFYILMLFDKIDQSKLHQDVRFDKDLGLDSLDMVEVCVALENEFNCEITVETMDLLLTPREIIDFLADLFSLNH